MNQSIEIMDKVISTREESNKYKKDNEIIKWLETFGEYI